MKQLFSLVVCAALAAACEQNRHIPNVPIQKRTSLSEFASCDALEGYIEDGAVKAMRIQGGQGPVRFYGLADGAGQPGPMTEGMAPTAKTAAGPGSHTGTN